MATAKYDWQEIKRAYLQSDMIEVEGFLKGYLGLDPKKTVASGLTKNIVGWRKEKEALKVKQTEIAKAELENDPSVKISTKELLETKKRILNIVSKGLKEFEGVIEFDQNATPIINKNAQGLKIFLEMIKVELNEPTSYVKNDNNNKDESQFKLAEAVLKLAEAKNKQNKK